MTFGDLIAWARARFQLRKAEFRGWRVRLWGRPALGIYGRLVLGDRVRLVARPVPLELAVGRGATLEIGNNVFINYGGSISASSHVTIEQDTTIGPHCLILDNDFHELDPARRNEVPLSRPVVLEKNVWLGARVIVLPGVRIGQDSVIGAGSVVTRDIPPGVLAAGVPAKVLRHLTNKR